MKIKEIIFFVALMLMTSAVAFSQKKDSIKVEKPKSLVVHSPRKAAILSTIIPGAGQVYNRKYWKVPIVYAGIGAFGYLFLSNRKEYNKAAKEIIVRNDTSKKVTDWTITNQYPEFYTASDILVSANQYRRYSELSAVGLLVFYSFQIVDAYVDAHLFTFDVSDDLSLHVEPTILQRNTPGVSIRIGFK